mgnify:CR=1 FL=1
MFAKNTVKETDLFQFEDEANHLDPNAGLTEEEKWARFDAFYAKVDAKKKRERDGESIESSNKVKR